MRFIQCCLCPKLIDTYKQNCGFELYKIKSKTDKVWFHLDCYYDRRYNRWGTAGPPRINGEPFVVRSEPVLLPVITTPTKTQEISEVIEAGEITIVNRPLVVKDVKSESMSKYFEDVSMREVAHASNKALDVVNKRFRKIVTNQEPENQLEKESESEKEREREEEQEMHEYQITRNVKIIEGKREDGSLILREVKAEQE